MKLIQGCFVFILIFISCSTQDREIPTLEVGQEFTDSNVRVVTIDTFTVRLTTFKFDSINSSNGSRLLVGKYQDDLFGEVASESYFELSATSYSLPNDAELDSIALILGYDTYFYSDTTRIANLNVHTLLEDLEPEEDVFFNTSRIAFDSVPLVTRRYIPEPRDEDSLHISIPIEFGQEIFDLIQENDINEDNELRELLKGFTLQPGAMDNASVIGFSRDPENTYLRFFYSIPDEFEDIEQNFDLFINQNLSVPRAFNHMGSQVSGTPLEQLTDQEINLDSNESNDLSFIQSGAGYATRVEFPTIRDIGELQGTGTVLSAILELRPPTDSFDGTLPIRDSLNVDILDQNNVIVGRVRNGNGAVVARVNEGDAEFNDTFYQIPLGVYIDRELAEFPIVEDALVLYPQNYNETVDRVVLGGWGNNDFKAKLILTYAIYDE